MPGNGPLVAFNAIDDQTTLFLFWQSDLRTAFPSSATAHFPADSPMIHHHLQTAFPVPCPRLLDSMEINHQLPKTILYSLNPKDNEVLATMAGNFQGGGMAGKVQFGSGWWYNAQQDGMIRQLTQLSQMGLLSHFIGMLTDSRSFLSYTRHEYFRRILCNMIGTWVEQGEVPNDPLMLRTLVENVCFNNAQRYFALAR